jgi:hypothetical protein
MIAATDWTGSGTLALIVALKTVLVSGCVEDGAKNAGSDLAGDLLGEAESIAVKTDGGAVVAPSFICAIHAATAANCSAEVAMSFNNCIVSCASAGPAATRAAGALLGEGDMATFGEAERYDLGSFLIR